ncbi:MAG TPA: hypothetical protein VKS81_04605, partial [Bacteroidota bacterium]|nr:hypothetical protein [Bacteroidota bacterium]
MSIGLLSLLGACSYLAFAASARKSSQSPPHENDGSGSNFLASNFYSLLVDNSLIGIYVIQDGIIKSSNAYGAQLY